MEPRASWACPYMMFHWYPTRITSLRWLETLWRRDLLPSTISARSNPLKLTTNSGCLEYTKTLWIFSSYNCHEEIILVLFFYTVLFVIRVKFSSPIIAFWHLFRLFFLQGRRCAVHILTNALQINVNSLHCAKLDNWCICNMHMRLMTRRMNVNSTTTPYLVTTQM